MLDQGRLVEEAPSRQLLTVPRSALAQRLVGAARAREGGATPPAPQAAPLLLELNELRCWHPLPGLPWQRRWYRAVDGVSLELREGEILGVVGASGCGKSTLCRALMGLAPVRGGSVRLKGQELGRLSGRALQRARRSIQMVFQDPLACLNPTMRVGEAIADPLLIHGLASRGEAPAGFDAELLRHATRVVDVGHRAATRVAVATPQLHRDADDAVPGLEEQRRGDLAQIAVQEAFEPEAPLVLSSDTPAGAALNQLLEAHGHCLVLEADGWVAGLVTLADLQRGISAGGPELPLADCRRAELVWLAADANLSQLEDQLRPNGLRQLPVFRLEDPALPKLPVGPPAGGLPLAALEGLASRDGLARAVARQLTSLASMVVR